MININITLILPHSKARIKKWDFVRHYVFKVHVLIASRLGGQSLLFPSFTLFSCNTIKLSNLFLYELVIKFVWSAYLM